MIECKKSGRGYTPLRTNASVIFIFQKEKAGKREAQFDYASGHHIVSIPNRFTTRKAEKNIGALFQEGAVATASDPPDERLFSKRKI